MLKPFQWKMKTKSNSNYDVSHLSWLIIITYLKHPRQRKLPLNCDAPAQLLLWEVIIHQLD